MTDDMNKTNSSSESLDDAIQPKPKWLDQVPFNPMLLDLDVQSDQIKFVFRSLHKISVHWYDIGVDIGVPVDKLEEIESDYSKASVKLTKMIAVWIDSCEDHSWRVLLETLFELGHNAAANAVIKNACLIFMKDKAIKQELPERIDWNQKEEKVKKLCSKISVEISKIESRKNKLLEKLCQLLNIPSTSEDGSILDNINQHILNCPSLTRDNLREVVFTINVLSELFHRRSVALQSWVEEIDQDIKNSGKVRVLLIRRKQELKEHLFKLNEKVKVIKILCEEKRKCRPEVQSLLSSLVEYEAMIHNVKLELERCIKGLHYANCNYQSLSDALSDYVGKLELSLNENRKMKAIAVDTKKISNVYSWLRPASVLLSGFFHILHFHDKDIFLMVVSHFLGFLSLYAKYIFPFFITLGIIVWTILKNVKIVLIMKPCATPKVVYKTGFFIKTASFIAAMIGGLTILPWNVCFLLLILGSILVLGIVKQMYLFVDAFFYQVVIFFISWFGASFFVHLHTVIRYNVDDNLIFPFLSSALIGFTGTVTAFSLQTIRTGHFEDPIQYKLFIVGVGMMAGIVIESSSYMNQMFVSVFANALGILVALKCMELQVWHYSSLESFILDMSTEVFDDNIKNLKSIINKIKEIQVQLIHIEHPYGNPPA